MYIVGDKNRLTMDWTHHKRFEALTRYTCQNTRKTTPFVLEAPVWCRSNTHGHENQ